MYNVDENFATCWSSKSRYDEVTGTMTLTSGTSVDLELNQFCQNSISISSANTKDGKDIVFGVVHANMLKMSIYTELDRYALFGAEIVLTYTAYNKKPVEGIEYISSDVPLGRYIVADVEKNGGIASITAYDYMKKLDEPFGSTVFSGTPYDVLSSVSEKAGVPFEYTATDMQQFFNYNEVIQFDSTSGLKTYRDVVSATCQMLGVCCRADRETGGMDLYMFSITPDATIPATGWYLSQAWVADYNVRFNGFSATSVKGTYKKVTRSIPGITMTIEDAPAWDYGIPASLRDRSVALADFIVQLQYTPCDITIFNTPIYDCGDMLHVEVNGVYVNTLLTEIEWSFQSPVQIKSTGTNVLLESTKSEESSRQISRGGESNKLVSYDVTNENELILQTNDTETLCDIAFNSAQETHCVWLANILVETQADSGSDYTDLKITYNYDGNEIIFYPQEHYTDGNHTFSLFYPLSSVTEQSVHRWKVDITSLSGTVTILEKNFKGTLFGQNLVEQEYWDGIIVLDDIIPYMETVASPITITDSGVVATIYDPNDEEHKLWVISGLSDVINACNTPTTLITVQENCIITLKWAFSTVFCRSTNDASLDYAGSYLLI